ncbi:hypothetical protein QZH41_000431 [Actinostola sp. cb2023]|nr:hypothetical protein QZH41_000431 [Actinostola sp. cb2023]
MENGKIDNSQITTSLNYGKCFDAYTLPNARLNMQSHKTRQWIQIDLGSVKKVTAIATQGHTVDRTWIKTYQILSGDKRNSLALYDKGKIFTGNTDSSTVVKNLLDPPIKARYIRVVMKSWQTWPGMKIELYGCDTVSSRMVCTNGYDLF